MIKLITDRKTKEAAWIEIFGKKPSKTQLKFMALFDCSIEEIEERYKTNNEPKYQNWEEAKKKYTKTSKGLVYRMF